MYYFDIDHFSSEQKLIKILLISVVFVILVGTVLYFNYVLLGEFFSTIFFSLLVAFSLKPVKYDLLIKLEYILLNNRNLISNSVVASILDFIKRSIFYILNIINQLVLKLFKFDLKSKISKTQLYMKIFNDKENNFNELRKAIKNFSSSSKLISIKSPINESSLSTINLLQYSLILYFLAFKVSIKFFFFLIVVYIGIDFIFRSSFDLLIFVFTKLNLMDVIYEVKYLVKDDISDEIERKVEMKQIIHTIISSFLIILGLFFFSVLMILVFYLSYKDMSYVYHFIKNNYSIKKYVYEHVQNNINIKEFIENNIDLNNFSQFSHFNSSIVNLIQNQKNNSTNTVDSLYDSIQNISITIYNDPLHFSSKYLNINSTFFNETTSKCFHSEDNFVFKIIKWLGLNYTKKFYCVVSFYYKYLSEELRQTILEYSYESYLLIGKFLKMIVKFVFNNLLWVSFDLVNYIMLFIIFLTCVFYILNNTGDQKDLIIQSLDYLPLDKKVAETISQKFKISLQGIFISSFEIFVSHFLITWLFFDFSEIPITFIFSIIAGTVSILPIFSPFILLIPASTFIVLKESIYDYLFIVRILGFNLGYILLINSVLNEIYKNNFVSHPYVTGLSFVMGFYSLGFKGIIYGPTILCASIFINDLISLILIDKSKLNKEVEFNSARRKTGKKSN